MKEPSSPRALWLIGPFLLMRYGAAFRRRKLVSEGNWCFSQPAAALCLTFLPLRDFQLSSHSRSVYRLLRCVAVDKLYARL